MWRFIDKGQQTLTGALNPTTRRYRAVYQQCGQYLIDLLPELRRAWRETYHGDTAAMATAMLDPCLVSRDNLCRGHLDEVPGFDPEQLTLLHPDRDGISVYRPNQHGVWLLSSRHRLAATAEDLFTITADDTEGT